ncbi:hypothetical protein [Hymenobacter terrenus]|uniref:hypothetical protein n=1 Tax=Hymenobacter terrenus TaxID=1629124 RepID=UPI0006198DB2|nr:hypothetical protein [Hymenobacter terrenus]
MKRATAVLRHYSQPDATMRQDMRTMYEHYIARQAAFQAFDPEFDATFGPDWLVALNTADTTPDHSVRVGDLKEDTDDVEDVMEQARRAVQTVFYYVGRAFPNNAGRLATYGRSTYAAARNNHNKMRTLLQTAFTSATRDQAALAAKGYSAEQLAALGSLVAELTATNTTQEVTKGTNTEQSDHYITVQNLAYGFGQEVSAAAKLLFAADAATLALFRLGGATSSGLEHHELTVAPRAVATVAFTTPLLDTARLRLRLAVPQPGQTARVGRVVDDQKLPYSVTLTTEISELDVLAPVLGPIGQVLMVENTSLEPVRVEMTVLN